VFKFVNSYNSLFYIAFFRHFEQDAQLTCVTIVQEPGHRSCLRELAHQLSILFGTMIVINNLLEVGIPLLKTRISVYYQKKRLLSKDKRLSDFQSVPEKEVVLDVYETTLSDYEELAIQFGYVCMFVTAFPLAPLLAILNNVIETRIDSIKVCKLYRRPEPRGADTIGEIECLSESER